MGRQKLKMNNPASPSSVAEEGEILDTRTARDIPPAWLADRRPYLLVGTVDGRRVYYRVRYRALPRADPVYEVETDERRASVMGFAEAMTLSQHGDAPRGTGIKPYCAVDMVFALRTQ